MGSTRKDFGGAKNSVSLGQMNRLYAVLGQHPNAQLLAIEVAGASDSFGVRNIGDGDPDLPHGLELIFDIQCPDVDPFYELSGDGFLRVNIDLFIDTMEISKTAYARKNSRYEDIAAEASTLLNLPIGGEDVIRPNGAMDKHKFNLP